MINIFIALRGENERLLNEINEKNRIIDELNKIRDEKEWSLGEHRQWLADANSRFVPIRCISLINEVFLSFINSVALLSTFLYNIVLEYK